MKLLLFCNALCAIYYCFIYVAKPIYCLLCSILSFSWDIRCISSSAYAESSFPCKSSVKVCIFSWNFKF